MMIGSRSVGEVTDSRQVDTLHTVVNVASLITTLAQLLHLVTKSTFALCERCWGSSCIVRRKGKAEKGKRIGKGRGIIDWASSVLMCIYCSGVLDTDVGHGGWHV